LVIMKLLTLRDHLEYRACPAIMAHQPVVGPIRRAVACPSGVRPVSSVGLSPSSDPGSDRVRQAHPGAAVGCPYEGIADTSCSAGTIRNRRDEWIKLGIFAQLKTIALDAYDRIVGLLLENIAVDGCITKAPGGGECAGPSPVDRHKQGIKRSLVVEGDGIPLGRVLAGANRHDSPLLAPTLDKLADLEPLPDDITVHLDSGYDSGKTREESASRDLHGQIAHKGEKAPIQASGPRPRQIVATQHSVDPRLAHSLHAAIALRLLGHGAPPYRQAAPL
jgi:Transposase DDE domain